MSEACAPSISRTTTAGSVAPPQISRVIAQRPDIAGAGARLGRGLGDGVGGVIVDWRAVVGIVQQRVQFILRDADQPQVEVLGHQAPQFLEQQRLVPPAQFGQLVVGDAIGPALRLGQMDQHDDRSLDQPGWTGGQTRPWPAINSPSAPTRQGTVQPNSAMLAAIFAT